MRPTQLVSPLQQTYDDGTHLENDEGVGKSVVSLFQRRQKYKEVLTRCITHQLQVVRRVLVMTRDVEAHHSLEEDLRGGMEREESIAIDVEEFAGRRVRAALEGLLGGYGEGSIEAEETVEPLLDRVARAVSDRSAEVDLLERACDRACDGGASSSCSLRGRVGHGGCGEGRGGAGHLTERLEELEGEGSTSSFVSVNGGRHEDEVGTEEGSNEGEGNSGCFVDDDQLRLSQDVEVLRLDVLQPDSLISPTPPSTPSGTHLDSLTMLTEDVDPDDGSLPLRVRTLNNIVVEVLLPSHLVESLEDEFEQRLQVLRAGTRHKDIAVRVKDGEGDGQSKSGGLSSSPCGGEGDGLGE